MLLPLLKPSSLVKTLLILSLLENESYLNLVYTETYVSYYIKICYLILILFFNFLGDYFLETIAPITNQLRKWLPNDPRAAWDKWTAKWAWFSVDGLLRSSYAQVKLALQEAKVFEISDDDDLAPLADLLPWPQEAVIAYSTFTYVVPLECSLVAYLHNILGLWWKDPMHTFENGLSMLPEAFLKKNNYGWNKEVELSKNIVFGVTAHTIEYSQGYVNVKCYNTTTKKDVAFKGDRVINTLPINIIRGLKFVPPLPKEYYQAFENINVTPSTKIMLQCRTRFWQEQGIQGGFTKTNMPIGQLHYPSGRVANDERGVLLCYTWKNEALSFGSQPPENAIAEAVEEIAEIHPEIKKEFEVGAVQAWYDDPAAQGAFCFLNPEQYIAVKELMNHPYNPIYFGGEGISFTNGWIQGAFEAGLRAAYQLFIDNENQF